MVTKWSQEIVLGFQLDKMYRVRSTQRIYIDAKVPCAVWQQECSSVHDISQPYDGRCYNLVL